MAVRQLMTGLICLTAFLFCGSAKLHSETYRLQVANVPEPVFMFFVEGRTLPHIEAFLDDRQRSKFVLIRDRQPEFLESVEFGHGALFPDNVLFPKRNDPWGVTSWDAAAGQVAVFRIRGKQSNFQKLRRVALETNGVLIRFPVRNIPTPRLRPMQVPSTSASYLAYLLESGTFVDWAVMRAASHNGLSVIVGRHHDAQRSDTVYLMLRMPQENEAYKVILGWETVKQEGPTGRNHGERD